MKTAVIVDSGSNYFNENFEMDGLFAIPLQIIDGDKAYLESVEISNDQVNDLLEQGKMLQTSLPSLGKIEELFKNLKEQGYDRVLGIPITSGISGTINAMVTAAQFAEIEFDYIDCYTTARVEFDLGIAARKLLDQGHDIPQVKEVLAKVIDKTDTFIVPDDLTHLSRGGRLSPLAAKLGGFLKIKPILHLNKDTKGVIEPFEKVRTMSKAIDTVINEMKSAGVDETYAITVVDVRAHDELDATVAKLKKEFPNTILHVGQLISTVSVHCGIGSIAFQYMKLPEFV
ncbi:DegV family protein [Erysipelothrix sp. HDW6C]|uniref:DegV family protein n=1 Tax=Erysipelothrix sp. HDW6C TaxID=2714930 RepID=UPI00140AE371|nr:DegV family protein [Erysipelothrix sp. HDW6C]QIK69102.1 DegV family protein [Erysipelothrix sp. HDW6C]